MSGPDLVGWAATALFAASYFIVASLAHWSTWSASRGAPREPADS